MECPRCLMDDSIEGIVIKKQCNICDMHDRHEKFFKAVKIPKGKAILGISGGLDSSWLAYWAYTNGLDVLLVHFDNGFNADAANKNILKIVAKTGYPFLRFHVDHHYYRICRALLKSGLPDVDIANDLGMAKLVLDVAKQYGIKWIINGHNYRTEGWNPIGWTYMDGRYLRSIVGYVPEYMNLKLLEQFRGVRQLRAYYYLPPMSYIDMESDLVEWCDWRSYGEKHAENVYTKWAGSYLKTKHGIDKRRNYLSAEIRCGRISKEYAKAELKLASGYSYYSVHVIASKLGYTDVQQFQEELKLVIPINYRAHHKSYRSILHKLWPLVWLASKMKLVPESFYRKYCR